MGILDQIGTLAGDFERNQQQGTANSQTAGTPQQPVTTTGAGGIAGALMQAVQQHPGGIGGILSSLRQNGLGDNVSNWASGQETSATPQQVQQGLNGTGIVENTAQRAGVPQEIASAAIAALLPALIRHFAPGGQAPAPGQTAGLAEQFLSRML